MARPEDRYAKVLRRMWADAVFLGWSKPQPNAQSLWQYILTTPVAGPVPGVFVLSLADTAERLGWSLDETRKSLAEIVDCGRAMYDTSTRLLYLPNAVHIDPPKSPNVVVHWRRHWMEIPPSELKSRVEADILAKLTEIGDSYVTAWNVFASKKSERFTEVVANDSSKSSRTTEERLLKIVADDSSKPPATATDLVTVLSEGVQGEGVPTRADLTAAEVLRRADLFPGSDARDLDAWARGLLKDPDLHLPPTAQLWPYVRAALRKLSSKVAENPSMKSRLGFVQGAAFGMVNDDKASRWASGRTDGREGVCAPFKGRERASSGPGLVDDDFGANAVREMEELDRKRAAEHRARGRGGDAPLSAILPKVGS